MAAPLLRFAWAERFDEDALGGRVPAEARRAEVRGGSLSLRVLPLPEEGRPPWFSGAVGRFRLTAEAAEAGPGKDDVRRLTVRVEGEGNLAGAQPPRVEALRGIHCRGRLEVQDTGGRTWIYEVEPLSPSVTEIPPLEFPYFDPGPPAGYRVAASAAIPIRPRTGLPDPPGEGRRFRALYLALSCVVLPLAAVCLLLLLRVRRGRAATAAPSLLGAAAEAFRRRAPAADPGEAFAAFLAALLGAPPAAVVGPDLADRLLASGVPEDLAVRSAVLLERLVEARYGGGPPPPEAAAEARALVDALAGPDAGHGGRAQ